MKKRSCIIYDHSSTVSLPYSNLDMCKTINKVTTRKIGYIEENRSQNTFSILDLNFHFLLIVLSVHLSFLSITPILSSGAIEMEELETKGINVLL